MNSAVLGIDLGTSSVKVLARFADGTSSKIRETYDEISPRGWKNAVEKALCQIDGAPVSAIGLSSQVGTYVTDADEVISWNSDAGKEELAEITEMIPKSVFMEEIGMVHPAVVSYPLPRLLYIKKHKPHVKSVCQPKELLTEFLTGKRVSDPYSWRGLANAEKTAYSRRLLKVAGLSDFILPPLSAHTSLAGKTHCAFLPEGVPVFTGLNDFYAGLLGMGIGKVGDMFDVTGTSEHIGVVENAVREDSMLVSSPYFTGAVHYGVTASGGASLSFGRKLSDAVDIDMSISKNPPIFLPYLCGERAPIWDPDAKGVFYGITDKTDKADLAYAVMEGVAFSLLHICTYMDALSGSCMVTAGGAAQNDTLNQLKAEILGKEIVTLLEADTSALGAAMVASEGIGRKETIHIKKTFKPSGKYDAILKKRFSVYTKLYPALRRINKGEEKI